MTTCDRCGERTETAPKRGAFGYSVLCLSCYADLKDWNHAVLGED